MKNLFIRTFFPLMIVFYSSCTNNALDYMQNVKQIKGEKLQIDCFIGNPYSMTNIDTLLFFYDRYDGNTISVIDVKNNQFVSHIISEGNGPGEVVTPVDILGYPQEGELYISQRHLGYLSIFNIPKMQLLENISFQERPEKIHKLRDYYVGEAYFEKGRFGIYDQQGKILRTDGIYPFRGKDIDFISSALQYQANYCANPLDNFFAVGCLYCDNIEFYEVKENETVLLKEYSSYDVKSKIVKSQNTNHLVIEDNCIISYVWAYGTDAYCYMLYSGKTLSENNHRHGWGRYIIIFDWKGNYIKTLITDREIRTFCVDKTNTLIYAITQDNEGEHIIERYKI